MTNTTISVLTFKGMSMDEAVAYIMDRNNGITVDIMKKDLKVLGAVIPPNKKKVELASLLVSELVKAYRAEKIAKEKADAEQAAQEKADKAAKKKAEAEAKKQAEEAAASKQETTEEEVTPMNVLSTLSAEQQNAVATIIAEQVQIQVQQQVQFAIEQMMKQQPVQETASKTEPFVEEEAPVVVPPVVEAPVVEAPKAIEVDVTENIQDVYNTIQNSVAQLSLEITDAYKQGKLELAKQLEKQQKELLLKSSKLNRKFAGANLATNYRNSIAGGLRQGAAVTRKYGHGFIDSTMNLVNEVLGAGFKVVDVAVNGTIQIVGAASSTTRKLGHFTVELAANGQDSLADVIEKK